MPCPCHGGYESSFLVWLYLWLVITLYTDITASNLCSIYKTWLCHQMFCRGTIVSLASARIKLSCSRSTIKSSFSCRQCQHQTVHILLELRPCLFFFFSCSVERLAFEWESNAPVGYNQRPKTSAKKMPSNRRWLLSATLLLLRWLTQQRVSEPVPGWSSYRTDCPRVFLPPCPRFLISLELSLQKITPHFQKISFAGCCANIKTRRAWGSRRMRHIEINSRALVKKWGRE